MSCLRGLNLGWCSALEGLHPEDSHFMSPSCSYGHEQRGQRVWMWGSGADSAQQQKHHGGNFEARPMELAAEISTLTTRGVTKFSSVCVVQKSASFKPQQQTSYKLKRNVTSPAAAALKLHEVCRTFHATTGSLSSVLLCETRSTHQVPPFMLAGCQAQ